MKKIRWAAGLLILALLMSVACGCGKDPTAFAAEGVRLSVSDFCALYRGEQTLADCQSQAPANFGVSDVKNSGGYLSFYMMLESEKNYEVANYMGQMYIDETLQKAGIPATVSYLVESDKHPSILLFQTYDSTEPDDSLLIHPELSGKPHLKVYLIDSDERMYFFELELPTALSGLNTDSYEAVNAYDTWAQTFLDGGNKPQVEG